MWIIDQVEKQRERLRQIEKERLKEHFEAEKAFYASIKSWGKKLGMLALVGYGLNFGYVHLVPKYQFSFKEGDVVCRCNRFTGKVERLNLTRGWAKNTSDWHAYEE